MKTFAWVVAILVLACVGCGAAPLADGTYYAKAGKIGTLPDGGYFVRNGVPGTFPDGLYAVTNGMMGRVVDGIYRVLGGAAEQYDPKTGATSPIQTTPVQPAPVPDPTTSQWKIIGLALGAYVLSRVVGIAVARVPFLAPIAPYVTGLLGGSGFRPAVVTTQQPANSQQPPA